MVFIFILISSVCCSNSFSLIDLFQYREYEGEEWVCVPNIYKTPDIHTEFVNRLRFFNPELDDDYDYQQLIYRLDMHKITFIQLALKLNSLLNPVKIAIISDIRCFLVPKQLFCKVVRDIVRLVNDYAQSNEEEGSFREKYVDVLSDD